MSPARQRSILVWDVPTRVFHWLLALAFALAYATGDSERWRDVHVLAGYTMAGLLAFRVAWGLVGSRYARFRSFLFGPRAVTRYLGGLLHGRPQHYVGHNPAGSVAIYLVLALGALAAATGYAAYAWEVDWLSEAHEGAVGGLLALVLVHIAGVAVSSAVHGENLVRAMITGRKRGDARDGIRRGHAWLGIVLVAAVMAFWYQDASEAESGSRLAQSHDGRRGTEAR